MRAQAVLQWAAVGTVSSAERAGSALLAITTRPAAHPQAPGRPAARAVARPQCDALRAFVWAVADVAGGTLDGWEPDTAATALRLSVTFHSGDRKVPTTTVIVKDSVHATR